MTSLFRVVGAVTLMLAAIPMEAAMPPSCPMHGTNKPLAPSAKTMTAFQPLAALASLLPTPVLRVAAAADNHEPALACPRMESERQWKEWRARNPKTPSRYANGKNKQEGLLIILTFNSEDPEPDPGFGQCGCTPEVALAGNGCGWIHENIWQ